MVRLPNCNRQTRRKRRCNMNKTIKIAAVCVAAALCAGTTFARGHRGPARGHGRAVRHHHVSRPVHHRHCHGSAWGRGGRNFWPGFVGGIVGGVIADRVISAPVTTVVTTPAVVTAPTVVTTPVVTAPVVATPVYTTQNVWVEGRYVDQVQANGTMVRVWQPGHYEQRQVLVQ